METIKNHGLSVRRAAEEYAVPKSTLHDRVSGRVLAGRCSGPPKYLTDEEEVELERYLTHCSSVGFSRSRQQVIQIVQEVVTHKGMVATVTHGWWESFRRRHPKLTLRTAAPMSYARAMASDPDAEEKQRKKEERALKRLAVAEEKEKQRLEKERKRLERGESEVKCYEETRSRFSTERYASARLRLWDDHFTICSQQPQGRVCSLEVCAVRRRQ